jgi:hypothetical protein
MYGIVLVCPDMPIHISLGIFYQLDTNSLMIFFPKFWWILGLSIF